MLVAVLLVAGPGMTVLACARDTSRRTTDRGSADRRPINGFDLIITIRPLRWAGFPTAAELALSHRRSRVRTGVVQGEGHRSDRDGSCWQLT